MYQQRVTMRMGPKLTRLTRNLLIALVALYMIQLVLENWLGLPVLAYVAWWGPSGSSGLGAFSPSPSRVCSHAPSAPLPRQPRWWCRA